MARTHARVFASIWQDEAFIALSPGAQRTYLLLLSQSDVSSCGILAYRPQRWAQLAAGTSAEDVVGTIRELVDTRFVVVDRATGELWIRSFVKHDGILKSPNMVKAMWAAFGQVMSAKIREQFAASVAELQTKPELAENPKPNPSVNPSAKGSENPKPNPSRKTAGKGKGVRGNPTTDAKPERGSLLAPAAQSESVEVVDASNVTVLPPRDLLWEAMLDACGIEPPITDTARSRYNTALAKLRKVNPTPDEIRARAGVYRMRFPTAALTPSALESHWSDCVPERALEHVARPKVNGNLATLARLAASEGVNLGTH